MQQNKAIIKWSVIPNVVDCCWSAGACQGGLPFIFRSTNRGMVD